MATVRLFKQYIPAPFILLALIEFGIYAASVVLAVEVRFFGNANLVPQSVGAVAPKAYAELLPAIAVSSNFPSGSS